MKFHDIDQNSEEWFKLRAGKVTSSNLAKVMANYDGAFGDPAKKYAVEVAVSSITGEPASDGYTNAHMERGTQEEDLARDEYEAQMFCSVSNGGFFDHGRFGCSPDGVVNDGVIEIKSAIPSVHYKRIASQSFDSSYKWQLIANMKYTNSRWIDFVSYCSKFPEDKRLYIKRLYEGGFEKEYLMVDKRMEKFIELVDEVKEKILNSNYTNI